MKKDIFINLIITFGISLTLFLVNKYFALYMGKQNLGLMKLFTQLLAYLNLAEMGLASACAYSLYRPLILKDYNKISVILNTIKSLYNKIFIFILFIGILFNPIIPFLIKDRVDTMIYMYWSLYVVGTALNYTFIKYSILFTADQKFLYVRLVEGGSRIFCQILQILVIIYFRSFLLFIFLLILSNIVQYIWYRNYYLKHYSCCIKSTNMKDISITNSLKYLFWHRLAGLVVFNTDFILISKYISLEMVGVYASYQMVVQMVITILNIILNVLKPRIGKFIAENKKEDIFICWKILNILFLAISIILTLLTYKLINPFISLWLGQQFVLSNISVCLIMINLFIQSFRGITDIFKDGCGFFDDIYLPISEAVINFIISIVLVQTIGVNGVIIGTIISNLLIVCIAKPILVFKRCFNENIFSYIKIYSNYFFKSILCLFFFKTTTKIIEIDIKLSWIGLLLYGIKIFFIIFCITVIIFIYNIKLKQRIMYFKDKFK